MNKPDTIKPMKSQFYYRLNITDGNCHFTQINLEGDDLAKDCYNEKLKELQEAGKPFQINMSLIYKILEDDGERNCERYYLVAAHNEDGVFNPEGIKEDIAQIESDIASGFFS